jgi:ABC-type Zn uptake system ZnuABC Zn-binding protein ZnuA
MKKQFVYLTVLLFAVVLLAACDQKTETPAAEQGNSGEKLNVVATTTIVGDVVAQIGDERINLSVLLPEGTDPHSFEPTPQDMTKIMQADVVFANGAGLEEFLTNLIESVGASDKVVHVSEGIDLLVLGSHEHDHEGEEHDHEGEEHDHEGEEHDHEGEEHDHEGGDPHTWVDPNNVMVWVRNIEQKLSEADPANAEAYAASAKAYTTELKTLDAWIREQVAQIPAADRKLVTDHTLFGYFAEEYGFEQVGALIPGYSTLAEPTAREIAEIEDAIRELGVKAIFVGNTVNPALAQRIADDTGIKLIFIYTGSLSGPDGEAPSYIEYIRYNVSAFVEALK